MLLDPVPQPVCPLTNQSIMNLTINELLCFVSDQSDKLTSNFLETTIRDFYTLEEAKKAKQILLSEFDKVCNPDLVKEQRKERVNGKSSAKEKVVKDIIDIWQTADQETAGILQTQFVAADISRLPIVNADKYNVQFLVSSILKLQEQARQQTELNENILNTLLKVNKKLDPENSGHNRSLPQTPIRLSSYVEVCDEDDDDEVRITKTKSVLVPEQGKKRRLNSAAAPFVSRRNSSTDPKRSASLTTPITPAAASSTAASSNAAKPTAAPSTAESSTTASPTAVPPTAALSSSAPPTAALSTRETSTAAPSTTSLSSTASSTTASSTGASTTTTSVSTPLTSSVSPSVNSAASFAQTTKQLNQNNSTWLVKARKNKQSVTVIGKENSSGLKGVAPVTRDFWDLSVSRLAESTTDDQVKRHLQSHGIEVKEVFVFASKIRGTKAAKVRVSIEHRDKAKDGELWPLHCRVQDWIYKAKSSKEEN